MEALEVILELDLAVQDMVVVWEVILALPKIMD
jgi:hypothetical protein